VSIKSIGFEALRELLDAGSTVKSAASSTQFVRPRHPPRNASG